MAHWLINKEKSITTPTRDLTFLGFARHTDSLKVDIPASKCEELRKFITELLEAQALTNKRLAALVGKLVAMSPDNRWAHIRSKTILRALNWNLGNSGRDYSRCCTLTERTYSTGGST